MVNVSTSPWESLEKWSAVTFLIAGILLLIGTAAVALEWLAGMEGLSESPLAFASFLGFVVTYIGLLGLYPRLADQTPRLARAATGLLLIPVLVILIDLVAVILGFTPPFAGTPAIAAFLLFALGVALLGVASLLTEAPSPAVGYSLLLFSVATFVLLGDGLLNGFPTSDPVTVGTTGLMVIAVLAIGYLLRTEPEPTDREEPAPETTVR